MQVLSYSPSCEAYAECGKDRKVYDLSPDITSMQVTRNVDGVSTFSLTLKNERWKYNGFFTPMDRIVLYCTKLERMKLLSGYITTCDVFSLYQDEFKLSGKCSLYKVKKWYWDPALVESQNMLRKTRNTNREWSGYGETITDLLTNVCNWPESSIFIGDVPEDAIKFAQEMYQANLDSANQLRSMADDFYEILQTHGPKASGFVSVITGDGSSEIITVVGGLHGDGAKYHQIQKNGHNCGAASVAVGLNILIGKERFDNLEVWYDMGSDTTRDLTNKTKRFIEEKGLSSVLEVYTLPGGGDSNSPNDYAQELAKGSVIISSSGRDSAFRNSDGSTHYHPNGHWIVFYHYSNGVFLANDSSRDKAAGAKYTTEQLKQWLDGRDYHCAFAIHPKGTLAARQTNSSSSGGITGAKMTFSQFMNAGVVEGTGEAAGYRYTYYSETELPDLDVPGRHVVKASGATGNQGYVCDKDGYIVLAKPAGGKWKKGDTLMTPFGKGKFYDHCPEGNIDVYVHYP